jgi:hypothetical protein
LPTAVTTKSQSTEDGQAHSLAGAALSYGTREEDAPNDRNLSTAEQETATRESSSRTTAARKPSTPKKTQEAGGALSGAAVPGATPKPKPGRQRLRAKTEGGSTPQHKHTRRRCFGRKNLARSWRRPGVRTLASGGAGTWQTNPSAFLREIKPEQRLNEKRSKGRTRHSAVAALRENSRKSKQEARQRQRDLGGTKHNSSAAS